VQRCAIIYSLQTGYPNSPLKRAQCVQKLQVKAIDAATHGHDHLRSKNTGQMDDGGEHAGLRAQYEGGAYPVYLEKWVRFSAHCVTMWSCFSLAYYCMDLVAIVRLTSWTTLEQVLTHTLLLLPHALLSLVISPAVMKHESLLSCVVRRKDELVAIVVEQMERSDRLGDSLRRKLVDVSTN
jgi:hypothetical protein